MNFNDFQKKIFLNNKWEELEINYYYGNWKPIVTKINQKNKIENVWNLPVFILNELQNYIEEEIKHNNNFKFSWWSDYQTGAGSMAYKSEEVSYINTYSNVNLSVMGGDIIDGNPNKAVAVDRLESLVNGAISENKNLVFPLMGNHDTNFYGFKEENNKIQNKENLITPPEFHEIALKHLSGQVIFDINDDKSAYYYKDFEDYKIRVISINTSDYFDEEQYPLSRPVNTDVRQSQFTWFCNEALNFSDKSDKNDWAIIILSHAALMPSSGAILGSLISPYEGGFSYQNGRQFRGVLKAFKEGGKFSMTSNIGGDWEIISNVDFENQGPIEVIGNFHGHAHLDRVWMYEGIPTIGIAGCNPTTRRTSYPTESDDIYEAISPYRGEVSSSPERLTDPYPTKELINAVFDTFEIDRQNKVIIAKRFGAGKDRVIPYG